MIVKMIKNLENKMEKMQESINRDLEELKEKEMAPHSSTLAWKTPWTVAYYAPPSIGFSRQEYWSGLPFPSPEDLPDPGIKPRSPAL